MIKRGSELQDYVQGFTFMRFASVAKGLAERMIEVSQDLRVFRSITR